MQIKLPSGTQANLEIADSKRSDLGLVVIPDVMGWRPLFDDLISDLSRDWGVAVCGFELFPGQEQLGIEERLAAVSKIDDKFVFEDAISAASLTKADRVGILGFCMGGMYTLKCVSTKRFWRHCAFYGQIKLPETWKGVGQAEPIACMEGGDPTSVLSIIGGIDPYTPPEDVQLLETMGASIEIYESADHGFVHDPSRPTHREVDAKDAWSKAKSWFLNT